MIITDLQQIDSLVREYLSIRNLVCVDEIDYERIKQRAVSLRAEKVHITEFNESTIKVYNESVCNVCQDNECDVLLLINFNENESEENAFTMNQLNMLVNPLINNAKVRDMITGLNKSELPYGGVDVLIVAGIK